MKTDAIQTDERVFRKRFDLKTELLLAILPTATVIGTLFFLEIFSQQHVLFTSLSSSAFLIYLDPIHIMNRVRTLLIAQPVAVIVGYTAHLLIASNYQAAGVGMVFTIILMISLDAMHPPAVATSLTFAFRTYSEHTLVLFGLALGLTVVLVGLEQSVVWLVHRFTDHQHK